MGEITDAIEAVKERGDLDRRQRNAEIAKLRAEAHESAITASREDRRLVFDRGDGRVITATLLERRDGLIKLHVDWTIDGKPQPFDNPWFVVNPPCLVRDDVNGDIVRERRDPDTGEVIETRRYREDPMAALIEVIDDKCRKPARQVSGGR